MSEDWKPGDLAVCVDAAPRIARTCSLTEGRTYRVLSVVPPAMWKSGFFGCGLTIEGPRTPNLHGDWAENRFRKVKPDQQEPCEAEFITLLNRTKRRVGA